MPVSMRQLHSHFTAEITDIDLRQTLDPATVAELVAALDRYAVLVFPGQAIDDDQQLAFGRLFGTLEIATFSVLKDRDHHRRHHQINYVSNLDPEGHLLPQDNRVRMYQLANRLWHTDSSFKKIPGRYSLLHARVVPSEGGETEFADLRAAYDALPAATKSKLDGLVASHALIHSNRQLGLPDFSEEEQAAMPPVQRPLVHVHRGSGRKTLYLASHASHIVGWPVPEGRVLILDLIEFATQREFVYRHAWQPGDLVMWDNRCTMHRVLAYDHANSRRELRRIMVQDAAGGLDGIRPLSSTAAQERATGRLG
jgi:alpha-ketoglutarate-dependent 2,4-dichlorophenoxyacetate dioxygenase